MDTGTNTFCGQERRKACCSQNQRQNRVKPACYPCIQHPFHSQYPEIIHHLCPYFCCDPNCCGCACLQGASPKCKRHKRKKRVPKQRKQSKDGAELDSVESPGEHSDSYTQAQVQMEPKSPYFGAGSPEDCSCCECDPCATLQPQTNCCQTLCNDCCLSESCDLEGVQMCKTEVILTPPPLSTSMLDQSPALARKPSGVQVTEVSTQMPPNNGQTIPKVSSHGVQTYIDEASQASFSFPPIPFPENSSAIISDTVPNGKINISTQASTDKTTAFGAQALPNTSDGAIRRKISSESTWRKLKSQEDTESGRDSANWGMRSRVYVVQNAVAVVFNAPENCYRNSQPDDQCQNLQRSACSQSFPEESPAGRREKNVALLQDASTIYTKPNLGVQFSGEALEGHGIASSRKNSNHFESQEVNLRESVKWGMLSKVFQDQISEGVHATTADAKLEDSSSSDQTQNVRKPSDKVFAPQGAANVPGPSNLGVTALYKKSLRLFDSSTRSSTSQLEIQSPSNCDSTNRFQERPFSIPRIIPDSFHTCNYWGQRRPLPNKPMNAQGCLQQYVQPDGLPPVQSQEYTIGEMHFNTPQPSHTTLPNGIPQTGNATRDAGRTEYYPPGMQQVGNPMANTTINQPKIFTNSPGNFVSINRSPPEPSHSLDYQQQPLSECVPWPNISCPGVENCNEMNCCHNSICEFPPACTESVCEPMCACACVHPDACVFPENFNPCISPCASSPPLEYKSPSPSLSSSPPLYMPPSPPQQLQPPPPQQLQPPPTQQWHPPPTQQWHPPPPEQRHPLAPEPWGLIRPEPTPYRESQPPYWHSPQLPPRKRRRCCPKACVPKPMNLCCYNSSAEWIPDCYQQACPSPCEPDEMYEFSAYHPMNCYEGCFQPKELRFSIPNTTAIPQNQCPQTYKKDESFERMRKLTEDLRMLVASATGSSSMEEIQDKYPSGRCWKESERNTGSGKLCLKAKEKLAGKGKAFSGNNFFSQGNSILLCDGKLRKKISECKSKKGLKSMKKCKADTLPCFFAGSADTNASIVIVRNKKPRRVTK